MEDIRKWCRALHNLVYVIVYIIYPIPLTNGLICRNSGTRILSLSLSLIFPLMTLICHLSHLVQRTHSLAAIVRALGVILYHTIPVSYQGAASHFVNARKGSGALPWSSANFSWAISPFRQTSPPCNTLHPAARCWPRQPILQSGA